VPSDQGSRAYREKQAEAPSQGVPLATGLGFPEGPAFDGFGNLWCVELSAGSLWQRTPHGEIRRHFVGGRPNGLAIDQNGSVWFCDSGVNAVRRLDPINGSVSTVIHAINGVPLAKPNDLAFDARGNLVFTCPGESRSEPTGYVCCLSAGGDLTVISDGLYFPNGLAFTAGDASLLIAETRRQRLWSGTWTADTCTWSGPGVFASTAGPIGPDGIAISESGDVYIAVHGTNQIEIKDANGRHRGSLSVGEGNPTNCAFDPSGTLGLVVTETTRGAILSFGDLGPGLALPPFRGSQAQISPG